MANCPHCQKRFKNQQAVRGHLRACPKAATAEPLSSRSAAAERSIGSAPAEHMLGQLRTEEARLSLREIQRAHGALDQEEREQAQRRQEARAAKIAQAAAAAEAVERTRLEAEERRRREAVEVERGRQRRKIIQQAKDRVDSAFADGLVWVPEAVRAAMLAEVEQTLSGMPVEELSFSEVVRSAEGVRTRHYRPVVEAHRQQEEEKRRRTAAKARLVAHGQRYAEDRLDAEGGQGFSRLGITLEVGSALDREIEGTEGNRDVEELVEAILAPKIKQIRREAEDHRRQEEARERRQQEQERALQHLARERQERAEETRLAANRQRLASDGYFYVLRLLNEENELEPSERFQVAREVKQQLLDELEGDESEEEVEDLADRVLDEKLGGAE